MLALIGRWVDLIPKSRTLDMTKYYTGVNMVVLFSIFVTEIQKYKLRLFCS